MDSHIKTGFYSVYMFSPIHYTTQEGLVEQYYYEYHCLCSQQKLE